MEVEVPVEGATEAVDEGHRAEPSSGSGAGAVRAQTVLHGAQEQTQSRALKIGIALLTLSG